MAGAVEGQLRRVRAGVSLRGHTVRDLRLLQSKTLRTGAQSSGGEEESSSSIGAEE